jgi:serine protease Do
MFGTALMLAAAVAAGPGPDQAPLSTLVLKDKASITGRVVESRPDMMVVDVGYTVLLVPRSAIMEVEKPGVGRGSVRQSPEAAGPAPKPAGPQAQGIYSTASTPPPERNVREQSALQGEAVVQVKTPAGLGSGYLINEDGRLVTNFHVIEGETKISVEVYHIRNGQLEQKLYKNVKILAINKYLDAALLKIDDAGAGPFKKVYLGESELLAVGDRVFAIGSPLGLERTVTEGIISTKTRQMAGSLYLQTTAQINPGNSGGPLFNMRGEVVGMINMKVTFGEGLGFAIPIEQVRWFLEHREAFAYENDNPSTGYRYLEPPTRLNHAPDDGGKN